MQIKKIVPKNFNRFWMSSILSNQNFSKCWNPLMLFQWWKYKHLWFLAEIKNNFPPWPFLSTTICILRCIGKDWRGIELDMSLFVFQGNILIFFVLRRSSPAFRIEDSIGSPCKVIYPKYSKYWRYLLTATMDCTFQVLWLKIHF